MKGRCKNDKCFAELNCVLGEIDKLDCENWVADEKEHDQPEPAPSEGLRVPWNGIAAGFSDLGYVATRGRPFIVGLLGPYDAGKTTFLAIGYSELLQRGHVGVLPAAGSMTLAGWENISRYMRWAPNRPATFPPHTSTYATRQPGLLHLALRDGQDLRDVLFTDAPGEWFTEWARNESSSAAEGSRWIARNADALALFVDSDRLHKLETRGEARNHYQLLVERCASICGSRPVMCVRTKSDVQLSPGIMEFLVRAQERFLPRAKWAQVSKDEPAALFDAFQDLVTTSLASRPVTATSSTFPVLQPRDPFLAFRGRDV